MNTSDLKNIRIHAGKAGMAIQTETGLKFVSAIGRNVNGQWYAYTYSLNKRGTGFLLKPDKI